MLRPVSRSSKFKSLRVFRLAAALSGQPCRRVTPQSAVERDDFADMAALTWQLDAVITLQLIAGGFSFKFIGKFC